MRYRKGFTAALLSLCTSCAANLAVVPPETSDRLAIADVLSRFAGAASAHDWAAAAELFAEDAVWSASAGDLSFRHEGRAKMLAWLTQNTANVEVVFYSAGTPSITLENDTRAQSRVSMTEVLFIKATGERRLLLGTYRDELEKVDGVWRFKKREVSIDHAEVLRGTGR